MRYGESETSVVRAYVKLAKNLDGKKKLARERLFYQVVTHLRVPRIVHLNPLTLLEVRGRHATEKDYQAVVKALSEFHEATRVPGDPTDLIRFEIYQKIRDRYERSGFTPIIAPKSVNGVKIRSFESALEFLGAVDIPPATMCMIHGDPHFGNIIMDEQGPVFIDPRGSFGGKDLYGVPEYDIAKVHLSLSGYNDLEVIQPHVNLVDGDMKISLKMHPRALQVGKLTALFLASIWLANAPGFPDDRAIISHYYALYMFELLFKKMS